MAVRSSAWVWVLWVAVAAPAPGAELSERQTREEPPLKGVAPSQPYVRTVLSPGASSTVVALTGYDESVEGW